MQITQVHPLLGFNNKIDFCRILLFLQWRINVTQQIPIFMYLMKRVIIVNKNVYKQHTNKRNTSLPEHSRPDTYSLPLKRMTNTFLFNNLHYVFNFIRVRILYSWGLYFIYKRIPYKVILSLFTPDVAYEYNNALKQQLPQH